MGNALDKFTKILKDTYGAELDADALDLFDRVEQEATDAGLSEEWVLNQFIKGMDNAAKAKLN